jgi:hypothetical protein
MMRMVRAVSGSPYLSVSLLPYRPAFPTPSKDILNLYYFLDPRDFEEDRNRMSRESTEVSKTYMRIAMEMGQRFPLLALAKQETYQQIPKQDNDPCYSALTAMVSWGSEHLPETNQAFAARQKVRGKALNSLGGKLGRSLGVRTNETLQDVEMERTHVFIDQHLCLERVM